MLWAFCGLHTSVKECQRARAGQVTWMRASGFSRLRISAACCCFSSSTMEAKVTVEGRGGLPTQGLRGTDGTEGQRERARSGWMLRRQIPPPNSWIMCKKTTDFSNHAPDVFTKKQFPIITLLTDNKQLCTLANKKRIYWPGITF